MLWGPRSSPHTKKTTQDVATWPKSSWDPPHHTGACPPGAAYLGDRGHPAGSITSPEVADLLGTPSSLCDPSHLFHCFWNLPLEQAALSSPSKKLKSTLQSHHSQIDIVS